MPGVVAYSNLFVCVYSIRDFSFCVGDVDHDCKPTGELKTTSSSKDCK